MAVEDEHLLAGDGVAVARLGGGGLDALLVPAAVGLGEGEGGLGLAGGDAGEQLRLGGVVAAVEDRVGREHDGGEVRGGEQAAAHLLEHHAQLDVAVAGAAVLLGDDEALQAHLLGHLAPDGVVEALLRLHQLADGLLGRLVLEEGPDDVPELFLLFGEGEVHCGCSPVGRAPGGRLTERSR